MPSNEPTFGDSHLPEREIARSVRLLRIRTLRQVRTRLLGAYGSVFHGPGMAFEELRHYEPGDDIRHIDWHVTARFGSAFVKRFAEERQLRVLLAIDVSASMDCGRSGRTKRAAACEAAAALALSAAFHGDRVGGLLFGGRSVHSVHPRGGERHALRLLRAALSDRPPCPHTDPRAALRMLGNLKGHAIVFLFSDMLFRPPLSDPEVRRLLLRVVHRHELVAIPIRDPDARSSARGVILQCEHAESREPILLDLYGDGARRQSETVCATQGQGASGLSSLGVEQVWLEAGRDCIRPLLEFFGRRERRRARSSAARGPEHSPVAAHAPRRV